MAASVAAAAAAAVAAVPGTQQQQQQQQQIPFVAPFLIDRKVTVLVGQISPAINNDLFQQVLEVRCAWLAGCVFFF